MLRWIEVDAEEMGKCLASEPAAELLIIGRTEEAMQRIPRRLRETEVPVNRTYELMSGRRADLLFAIRRMDRAVAIDLVAKSGVDSIANDVEWPLLAESLGYRVVTSKRMASHTERSTSSAPRRTAMTRTHCSGSGGLKWPEKWREQCGSS